MSGVKISGLPPAEPGSVIGTNELPASQGGLTVKVTLLQILNYIATLIVGIPAGGDTGQVLTKRTDNDYDAEWENSVGMPAGGDTGQVLEKLSGTDFDADWVDLPPPLPDGGTTGQVLEKISNADFDATWVSLPTPPVGIPTGGATGQVLEKTSNANYAVAWTSLPSPPVALLQSVEAFTLSPTDITNKYVTLAHTPSVAANVSAFVSGNTPGVYGTDFVMATATRLSWDTLDFDYVVAGDVLVANYWH